VGQRGGSAGRQLRKAAKIDAGTRVHVRPQNHPAVVDPVVVGPAVHGYVPAREGDDEPPCFAARRAAFRSGLQAAVPG
jgi:hypothetical protein